MQRRAIDRYPYVGCAAVRSANFGAFSWRHVALATLISPVHHAVPWSAGHASGVLQSWCTRPGVRRRVSGYSATVLCRRPSSSMWRPEVARCVARSTLAKGTLCGAGPLCASWRTKARPTISTRWCWQVISPESCSCTGRSARDSQTKASCSTRLSWRIYACALGGSFRSFVVASTMTSAGLPPCCLPGKHPSLPSTQA